MAKKDSFNSVETLPGDGSYAVFTTNTSHIFYETGRYSPIPLSKSLRIVPWGADNQMPYRILDKCQADETLTTCQQFNIEACYSGGLQIDYSGAEGDIPSHVGHFMQNNPLSAYFYGIISDFKYFGFCVTCFQLNKDGDEIVRIIRKEACNCRFSVANSNGRIETVVYGDFRDKIPGENEYEELPLLNPDSPLYDLRTRIQQGTKKRKFAMISRIPTVDSTYYPIPVYGSLFRSRWYDYKQIVTVAKLAKLKNSAPLKYHIEVSNNYWQNIFAREGITDRLKQMKRVAQEKENIINFLTGAENSGKALFSNFYVSPTGEEQSEVKIRKIETQKEGGDWSEEMAEAINMMCFAMGVHSNLVGSVPGKAQTNNSGSDKRELYTIAQARQRAYHDMLLVPIRTLIAFNQWHNVWPHVPFLQLTTLDEHKDLNEQ